MNNRCQKIRSVFLLLCFVFTGSVFLSAQSTAMEIETLLETRAVSYGQAARFVLEAADMFVTSSRSEAFSWAAAQNWLPKNSTENQNARLDGISLLIMRSFNIKGGIFYSMFKNPHYAYRELEYRSIIQGRAAPSMTVDGDTLLYLISRVLSMIDEDTSMIGKSSPSGYETITQRTNRLQALADSINDDLELNNISGAYAIVTDQGVSINISNIQFMPDSADLSDEEKERISYIAYILSKIPGKRILAAGHSALADTEDERMVMSLQRAEAVADYLILLGIRETWEISIEGYGAQMPIADNSTAEGMALNRRVEIIILE